MQDYSPGIAGARVRPFIGELTPASEGGGVKLPAGLWYWGQAYVLVNMFSGYFSGGPDHWKCANNCTLFGRAEGEQDPFI